ncbi:hypothetical protein [Enterovibrio norvegicus]|uniref:hypothetical protein n=1 Tax=Enterovibrio norvegicus TaxID=188144 RepID=UPI003552FD27
MKFRIILLLMLLGVLSGCATSPGSAYISVDTVENVAIYGEKSVIDNASPIPLEITDPGVIFISTVGIHKDDPVIDFGDYKSHYKLFEFKASKGENFRIRIFSKCDCLGFRKFILVPELYVADANGSIIETNVINVHSELSHISLELEGSATYSGDYYLVFGANNSKPGKNIGVGEAKVNGYIPTGLILSNSSHPYGDVATSYEIIK